MRKFATFLTICSVVCFYSFAEWIEVKKWDLQVYSDSTWYKLTKDTANWKPNGKTRFDSKIEMGNTLKVDGIDIVETAGIKFPKLDANNFNIRKGVGIQLGSNNQEIVIPQRYKNEKIEIVISSTNSTSERGISNIDNMRGVFGSTIGTSAFNFTVINNGDVSFTYSTAGGIILKSITVYKDDADPYSPALYRISGSQEQSIYLKQPISDIIYNWDNTAISAFVTWVDKIPAGITVTPDTKAKTIKISGTPTKVGTYSYTITATDSVNNTTSQIGTITVNALSTSKKHIAYITENAVLTDAADIAIVAKLRQTYNVDIIPANTSQPVSAFDIYDIVILSALPGSTTVQTCLKGINKPFVSLKPYMLNLWGWGNLVNMETAESVGKIKDIPVGVAILDASHPIFASMKVANGKEVKLATGSGHARLRLLTPIFSWTEQNESNIITLATVPSGAYNYTVTSIGSGFDLSDKPVIFEIKPNTVMSDGFNDVTITQKTIHIGVSEQAAEYLTPEYLTIVKNAVDYVLSEK
jgi:Putative Ig domain.